MGKYKDEGPELSDFLGKIGSNIRAIRERKGLTLEEVEEAGFASWRHLQRIESGKQPFTISTLYRVARALKVKPSELLKGY